MITNRDTHASILKKFGITNADELDADRAQKKLIKRVEAEGIPANATEEEKQAIADLGIEPGIAAEPEQDGTERYYDFPADEDKEARHELITGETAAARNRKREKNGDDRRWVLSPNQEPADDATPPRKGTKAASDGGEPTTDTPEGGKASKKGKGKAVTDSAKKSKSGSKSDKKADQTESSDESDVVPIKEAMKKDTNKTGKKSKKSKEAETEKVVAGSEGKKKVSKAKAEKAGKSSKSSKSSKPGKAEKKTKVKAAKSDTPTKTKSGGTRGGASDLFRETFKNKTPIEKDKLMAALEKAGASHGTASGFIVWAKRPKQGKPSETLNPWPFQIEEFRSDDNKKILRRLKGF